MGSWRAPSRGAPSGSSWGRPPEKTSPASSRALVRCGWPAAAASSLRAFPESAVLSKTRRMQSAQAVSAPSRHEGTHYAQRHVDGGARRLDLGEAGPPGGELVVLLHGFPEFWWSWRFQIPALAEAGFRVAAPDMRGYNLSDKPYSVEAYGIDHLVADIVGLIKALGRERA